MSDWDDLAADANALIRDTFYEEVSWTPAGGSPIAVRAVKSENTQQGEAVNPNYVLLWLVASDVVGITRGDEIVRNSTAYTVIDADPDGEGGIRVTLEKSRT
jgi:hypothetical protein